MIIDISEDGRTIEWWSNGERKIATIYQLIDAYDGIVRCKDCKWYRENEAYCVYWASIYVNADATPRYTPFDYCFRGVRKEGAEK